MDVYNKLFKRYPKIFCDYNGIILTSNRINFGKGWYKILEKYAELLTEHRLICYHTCNDSDLFFDKIDGLLDVFDLSNDCWFAETAQHEIHKLSMVTCELCGNHGDFGISLGKFMVRCHNCAPKSFKYETFNKT